MGMAEFVAKTRQMILPVAEQATYSSGGTSQIRLPKMGLLSALHVHVSGTMTNTLNTGTAALGSKGPWNLIKEFILRTNQGVDIVKVGGHSAHVLDVATAGHLYEPDDGQRSATRNGVYRAGAAAGANSWDYWIKIPVTPNDRDLIGLLLLQTDQMQADVLINWNTAYATDISAPITVTGNATAAFVGTAELYLELYTLPAEKEAAPDLSTLFVTLEQSDPISGVGENRFSLPRPHKYARILHSVEINGALDATNISKLELKYNYNDNVYNLSQSAFQYLLRRRYGRDLPDGAYIWDLMFQGAPGYGGGRDLIDAAAVSDLSTYLTVASGTTFGSGNNWLRTTTQRFVKVRPNAAIGSA